MRCGRLEEELLQRGQAVVVQEEEPLQVVRANARRKLIGQRGQGEGEEMCGDSYGKVLERVCGGKGVSVNRPERGVRKEERVKRRGREYHSSGRDAVAHEHVKRA